MGSSAPCPIPCHGGDDGDGQTGERRADSRLNLIRRSFPERARARDLGLARDHAARRRGGLPPTVRSHRPGREVAFGGRTSPRRAMRPRSRRRSSTDSPRSSARRAAGPRSSTKGRSPSRARPRPPASKRTYERFEEVAKLMRDALGRIGVADVRVGEVPGELLPRRLQRQRAGRAEAGRHRPAHDQGVGPRRRVVVASRPRRSAQCSFPSTSSLALPVGAPETTGSAAGGSRPQVDPDR